MSDMDSNNLSHRSRPLHGMFMAVPPRYDLVNHVITLGLDTRWRYMAASVCLEKKPLCILDLGCGTGDLTINLARLAEESVKIVGVDYSPLRPTSIRGAPFFAVNGRIRQEVDFGGNLTAQTGWQWRGETGRLFRLGFHYLNGKTDLYQFFREHEEQFAVGLWYDY